jgi:hypothetical protein
MSAILSLPTPQLAVIGRQGTGAITGTVSLTLPKPVFKATLNTAQSVALTLPTPTISIKGFVTQVGQAALTLPTPTLTARGDVTIVGQVALALPTPTLSMHQPSTVALALPAPSLAIEGTTGRVGNVQLVLPTPTLQAVGEVPTIAGVALALPKPQLDISGVVGVPGTVALALRGLALAIEGATGVVGDVALTLPVQGALSNDWQGGLSITGGEQAVGTVRLVLPMLLLRATGGQNDASVANPDGNVFPAMVMHTETGALWDYLNFPFNSLCQFNGVYLGASAEGVFALAGDTDNGALIDAAARVGITDFGTSFLKRIDRCYVGYRTDGNLVLRVFTDEINIRDYLITAYGKDGLHGNHTRIGKGLAARYWQFELRNQNGADFELNALELKPTHLRRRIGGGDA